MGKRRSLFASFSRERLNKPAEKFALRRSADRDGIPFSMYRKPIGLPMRYDRARALLDAVFGGKFARAETQFFAQFRKVEGHDYTPLGFFSLIIQQSVQMCLHEKNNGFAQSDTNALAFFFAARYNADMQYQPNKLRSVLCVKEIYTIHYFKYARGFAAKGESHDFWEMVYIDGGAAEIVAGERRFVLKQGEAVFHKPNEFHNILTHDKFANSVIVSFAGTGRGLDALEERIFTLTDAEKELLNGLVLEGSENFSDRLDDMYLQKMNKKPDAPFGGEQIIKNTLELLLISLIRGHRERRAQRDDGRTAKQRAVREDRADIAGKRVRHGNARRDRGKGVLFENLRKAGIRATDARERDAILHAAENGGSEKAVIGKQTFRDADRLFIAI